MKAISFQSVSKAYPSPRGPKGALFLALDDVSLDIEQGEFFGLLGPNGAGKTTMISILAGLAQATSGRVSVLGSDVQRDAAQARRKLGIVPQELVFDPFFNVHCSFNRAISALKITKPGSTSYSTDWAWPIRPSPICASSPVA